MNQSFIIMRWPNFKLRILLLKPYLIGLYDRFDHPQPYLITSLYSRNDSLFLKHFIWKIAIINNHLDYDWDAQNFTIYLTIFNKYWVYVCTILLSNQTWDVYIAQSVNKISVSKWLLVIPTRSEVNMQNKQRWHLTESCRQISSYLNPTI